MDKLTSDNNFMFVGFDIPNKQPPLYEGSSTKSLKYPELYSVPDGNKNDFYLSAAQYDLPLFPADTPNIIPAPATDFKQQSPREEEKEQPIDYLMPGGPDLDLSSLLALPTPANKDTDVFGSDPLDLFGFQPSFNNLDFMNVPPPDLGSSHGIHYWHGFEKDSSKNQESTQPSADPFVYGLAPVKGPEMSSMDTSNSPTTSENTMFHEDQPITSPTSMPSPMVEDLPSQPPSNVPVASEDWDHNLQDFFEQTFDLSDLVGDYMLPPPSKRQEDATASSSPDNTISPPRLPLVEKLPSTIKIEDPSPPPVHSPFPQGSHKQSPHKGSLPKGSPLKNKPKPVLLFGKDEGEIIKKLMALKNSARSKPITRDKLITMAVEEFNQLLDQAQLSEIEVAFMKEWRRRGKNKAAAQVARKRKREEVSDLDREVQSMRQMKTELEGKYKQLKSLVESLKERSQVAENRLLQKIAMEQVSHSTHLVHVTEDNKLLVIPRASSKAIAVNS